MQGERSSIGSLPETLNFENGSSSTNPVVDQQIRWGDRHSIGDNDLQNYMNTAADTTNTSFANSVYPEQCDLHMFSLGEGSSSGAKNKAPTITEKWMAIRHLEELRNDKVELNPLFMQPSSGANRVVGNLNAKHNGLESGLIPESGVRVGSGADGQHKRKALDAGIGQSSSSNVGFRELHRGESSSLFSGKNDLNMSLNHGPRGLGPGAVPNMSALPAIPESSNRNFSVRANPENVFAAGTVIRQPIAPSLSAPGDQQLVDLRYRHAFGNYTPLNPNASAGTIPPLSRNMIPPFQWNPVAAAAGGSSSSAAPVVDRNVVHRVETRERSNMLANAWTSVQPSPSLTPYQNNSAQNQRRISEHLRRRSLLSSLATHQRAARSSAPPAPLDQHVLHQSGGDATFQAQSRAYSRAVPRQGQQTTNGVSQSSRSLASTSRGRGRLAELRNVLEQMRRTGTLHLEDVMLLNQSMLGAAGAVVSRRADWRCLYRSQRGNHIKPIEATKIQQ
ncbi:BnaA10g28200D [Brassica napus]|uniref:BnaA10g28200D protein n=1 Tax=Brassica napus TaxID=3708 RepID=A0A078IFJ8_BRANA|nr:BnaA10g28200D [Brassica napus]